MWNCGWVYIILDVNGSHHTYRTATKKSRYCTKFEMGYSPPPHHVFESNQIRPPLISPHYNTEKRTSHVVSDLKKRQEKNNTFLQCDAVAVNPFPHVIIKSFRKNCVSLGEVFLAFRVA